MASYTLVKKPLTITGVFARGWDICINTFWSVFPFSFMLALIAMPGHLAKSPKPGAENGVAVDVSQSVSNMAVNSDVATQASEQSAHISAGVWGLTGVLILMALLVGGFIFLGIYAALIKRMDAGIQGKHLNFIEALFMGFGKSFSLLGSGILSILAILLGLVLLVVPGIYIGIALFFSYYLIILENMGVMASLKESKRLVAGHWWRTFFTLFVATLLTVLFNFFVGFILGLMFKDSEEMLYSGITTVMLILTQAISSQLLYAFILSIYYDLQSRKEGAPVVVAEKH